jgi:hypothetical protein
VYLSQGTNPPLFRAVAGPSPNELQRLVEQIAARVGQVLEQLGLIERDIENAWMASDGEFGPLDDLIGHSITYRIAVGPRAGQKLFTLQTVSPPRLCRYVGRPPLTLERLALTARARCAIRSRPRTAMARRTACSNLSI